MLRLMRDMICRHAHYYDAPYALMDDMSGDVCRLPVHVRLHSAASISR